LEQALSERQWRFLKAAQLAAGNANRFRWRVVGASLGFDDEESWRIADFLERRVAIVLPTDHEGQLLPLGRALIQQWSLTRPGEASRSSKAEPIPARARGRAGSEAATPQHRRGNKRGRAEDRPRERAKRHHPKRRATAKGR